MNEANDRAAEAILRARQILDEALDHLTDTPVEPATEPAADTSFTAHALNNFLTVAMASIELLDLKLLNYPEADVRKLLDGLRHTTDLMSHTVKHLQDGKSALPTRLRTTAVQLPALAQRAVSYYQRAADRKKLTLLAGSTVDVPLVWTDGIAVAAVFDNFLSNAIKYSPSGGKVWVQVARDGETVLCEVKDQGPGLSDDDQAKLFGPGVKLTPRPSAGESSYGYGLAVAKNLIERLGGSIGYDRTPGGGSCFWFRLPIQRPESGPDTNSIIQTSIKP